jgi:hypothetical protein
MVIQHEECDRRAKKAFKNSFQECFLHPYSCWQKCIVAQRVCFEGNVAETIVNISVYEK